MQLSGPKVPGIIVCSTICFALGVALGVLSLIGLGYSQNPALGKDSPPPSDGAGPPGPPAAMAGMAGGGRGAGRGGMPGFGRGPNSKNQLATLVAKLDQLSAKPLAIRLDEARRKKVQEQLQGLEDLKELSEEDAKKRLEGLLQVVEDQRATLEAAGYRWPGQGGGFRPPADVPNPFKDEQNDKHLKSLRQHIAEPTPSV